MFYYKRIIAHQGIKSQNISQNMRQVCGDRKGSRMKLIDRYSLSEMENQSEMFCTPSC